MTNEQLMTIRREAQTFARQEREIRHLEAELEFLRSRSGRHTMIVDGFVQAMVNNGTTNLGRLYRHNVRAVMSGRITPEQGRTMCELLALAEMIVELNLF